MQLCFYLLHFFFWGGGHVSDYIVHLQAFTSFAEYFVLYFKISFKVGRYRIRT
jgi:hypothetical protein